MRTLILERNGCFNVRDRSEQMSDIQMGRDPVVKALELLSVIIDMNTATVGVREVASKSGMSPSTVHRILGQLEKLSLMQKDGAGRYAIGLELYRWGRRLATQFPLREAAMPELRKLVGACNETGFLGVYNPRSQQMMYSASVESTHTLRYVIPLEEWRPVYSGASGLAILAFLPAEEQQEILGGSHLTRITRETVTDTVSIRGMIDQIREDGVALSRSQNIDGAVGVAAPIFDAGNRVIGDVVLTIPEQRFNPMHEGDLRRRIISCASQISIELGAEVRQGEWPPRVALAN
jgi:IclR family acetate operon transcriptional repressor